MTAECSLCGAPAVERFGKGWLCEGCIPDPDGDLSEDPTETEGADTSASFSNESETAGDAGVDEPDANPRIDAGGRGVPDPLVGIGAGFVPIDPRTKRHIGSRDAEDCYAADDDVFQAYLEAGHNYGVVCRGGVAVIDEDEPDVLAPLVDDLPDTAWQVSGSRTSRHRLLLVPGLDEDIPLQHPETGENVGHVKAAARSYVVGPGSTHPFGGTYGPLQGDEIATVAEDDLRAILEEHGFLQQDDDPVGHDTNDDRPDLADHEPSATGADETTEDIRDVFVPIDDLRPEDLPLRSRATGTDATGWQTFDPSYRDSQSGKSLVYEPDSGAFHDFAHDESFGILGLFAAEQGIISRPWDDLDGAEWWAAIEAARDAGAPIPEYVGSRDGAADVEPVAVLPDTPRERADRNAWDWRGAYDDSVEDATLTLDEARDRTAEAIARAVQFGDRRLVEALPTLGKSYGAVKAAAETDTPTTILTTRGNVEQYSQLEEWAAQFGLSHARLPAFTRDCPTANGEHGDEWRRTVRKWYDRGATPQEIHALAEKHHGTELPCQHDGTCPWAAKWEAIDPDETDLLVGHYAHAHHTGSVKGRAVVIDEFPGGTYETYLDAGLERAISFYLGDNGGGKPLPFDDYTDLIEHRNDEERRAEAIAWLEARGERDPDAVLADDGGHAFAPQAIYTILAGAEQNLGNGWERADLPGDQAIGLFNRERGTVHLLRPPRLTYTPSVVALDGTPTPALWELALGEVLNHTQVLTDAERREYLTDCLGLQLVRTTEAVKPYNNPDHVAADRDAALLEAIADEHGVAPAVISSMTALEEYDNAGILDVDLGDGTVTDGPASAAKWYGNVLGSNEFASERVGAVIGSNHYGDGYIKKWGAYAGEPIERGEGKGTELSYGGFGDRILRHMREHDTLQAAMRFGRDANGATVYVHTNTLPEWVPTAGEGRVISTWSDGQRQVLAAGQQLGEWTTAELAAHPDVDVSERQVLNILADLRDRGVVAVEQDGRGYTWHDDGLHEVSEHGDVDLEPVDLDEGSDETVHEIARSSLLYTWDFVNFNGDSSETLAAAADRSAVATGSAVNGGDRPPDDPV